MTDRLTERDYWNTVTSIADSIKEEARDSKPDDVQDFVHDRVHELLDEHPYVIYYANNPLVLSHTNNADAYFETMGEPPQVDNTLDMLVQLAYSAMQSDVTCEIDVSSLEDEIDLDSVSDSDVSTSSSRVVLPSAETFLITREQLTTLLELQDAATCAEIDAAGCKTRQDIARSEAARKALESAVYELLK